MLAAIALSLSRMAFVSVLGSAAMLSVLVVNRVAPHRKWSALAATSAILFVAFVFAAPLDLVQRFGDLFFDPTGGGRWPIAKDTLQLFAAYPVFGSGLGTFSPALLPYQSFGFDVAWANAHNDYLELLATLGILGFLLVGTLILLVTYGCVRASSDRDSTRRWLGLACCGSFVAILIHSVGDFNMFVPANAIALAWIGGISASLAAHDGRRVSTRQRHTRVQTFPVAVACISLLYGATVVAVGRSPITESNRYATLCQLGLCDADAALAAELARHNNNIGQIPLATLLEFLRRDPAGPNRWCDLGDWFRHNGRDSEARYSFTRAVELAPRIPYINFRAGSFFLADGDTAAALRLLATVLKSSVAYESNVFQLFDDYGVPADQIVASEVPTASVRNLLQRVLAQRSDERTLSTTTLWQHLMTTGLADDQSAASYIAALIREGDLRGAAERWKEFAGTRDAAYLSATYTFNGGFEATLTRSPFDWQFAGGSGSVGSTVDSLAYQGRRSARIAFEGTHNVSTAMMSQSVFLPTGRYSFRARLKSDAITTNEGVYFAIGGVRDSRVTTEKVVGTTDWHLVERILDVPADELVQVQLTRDHSLKFDNKINGTVWIDDVQIVPVSEGSGSRSVTARRRSASRSSSTE